ncbi:MAG: hypothetical protein JOZ75_00250 [Candidatus Dormibacteraeota bacterium]|nr:hypothetical protein [Candidatus Dormibacteraeota bacterium]
MAFWVAGGSVLITLMISDAVGTLVVTRGKAGRWRPTSLWYAITWRATRAAAARVSTRAADLVLNAYPAVSLLGLLVVWLVGLLFGWALVYRGLGEPVGAGGDWAMTLYFAGTGLLAASFGAAHGTAAELLSLVETVMGLGTVALLISYLPALYGAYSTREAKLLTLDDPVGGRLTPVRVIAVHAPHGDLEFFHRFCADWEEWTAEVLESHSSYPMLALFRSQHAGQSWITALGVVIDAAALACASIVDADAREPYFLYRRGQRAVVDIASRLDVPHEPWLVDWLNRDLFEAAWAQLLTLGVPLRDQEEAFERLRELRSRYGLRLQELIDYLLAPHGFWGHSAEATVVHEVAEATDQARLRARQASRRSR